MKTLYKNNIGKLEKLAVIDDDFNVIPKIGWIVEVIQSAKEESRDVEEIWEILDVQLNNGYIYLA